MPKDVLGREIAIGDAIVYPVRYSSSMWVSKGVVQDIKQEKVYRWGREYDRVSLKVLGVKLHKNYMKPQDPPTVVYYRTTVYRTDRVTIVGRGVEAIKGGE